MPDRLALAMLGGIILIAWIAGAGLLCGTVRASGPSVGSERAIQYAFAVAWPFAMALMTLCILFELIRGWWERSHVG